MSVFRNKLPTYIDENGEEGYMLTLHDSLILAYLAIKDRDQIKPSGRPRLERFAAAVDRRIATDALVGKTTSIGDAVSAVSGGDALLQKLAVKLGPLKAVDFVLDNVEVSP